MKSEAEIGFGTTLELALASAPTEWVFIAEARSHTPPGYTANFVDVTHMQSPNRMRESRPGLGEAGSSSHELGYVAGSTSNLWLIGARGKDLLARLTLPNGRQIIYDSAIEEHSGEIPLDETMTATLSLKVSGDVTLTAVAAPRNLALPTISGVPQVGVPLRIDEGAWAGAQELTYQWLADAAAISGATGRSYVPVAADEDAVISCAVTGANGSFSTTATSAATAAVAEAA